MLLQKTNHTQCIAGRSTFEHQGINSVSLRVNRAVGKSEHPKHHSKMQMMAWQNTFPILHLGSLHKLRLHLEVGR